MAETTYPSFIHSHLNSYTVLKGTGVTGPRGIAGLRTGLTTVLSLPTKVEAMLKLQNKLCTSTQVRVLYFLAVSERGQRFHSPRRHCT